MRKFLIKFLELEEKKVDFEPLKKELKYYCRDLVVSAFDKDREYYRSDPLLEGLAEGIVKEVFGDLAKQYLDRVYLEIENRQNKEEFIDKIVERIKKKQLT